MAKKKGIIDDSIDKEWYKDLRKKIAPFVKANDCSFLESYKRDIERFKEVDPVATIGYLQEVIDTLVNNNVYYMEYSQVVKELNKHLENGSTNSELEGYMQHLKAACDLHEYDSRFIIEVEQLREILKIKQAEMNKLIHENNALKDCCSSWKSVSESKDALIAELESQNKLYKDINTEDYVPRRRYNDIMAQFCRRGEDIDRLEVSLKETKNAANVTIESLESRNELMKKEVERLKKENEELRNRGFWNRLFNTK